MSDAPDQLPGPQPTIGGPNQDIRNRINNADISMFELLANEAGRTRTKGAGRDLINRRNNLLGTLDPYQRAKVGNQFYMSDPRYGRPDEGFMPQDSATNFIDLISRGDNDFLQGLADDYGSGGNTGPSGGGNSGGNNGGGSNTGGGNFDPNAFQSQIQQLIQTMFSNQQNSLNNSLSSLQGSAPTLSAGSVGNMYSTASDRANSRRSGIVNTLAQRGRRGSSRGSSRRYF